MMNARLVKVESGLLKDVGYLHSNNPRCALQASDELYPQLWPMAVAFRDGVALTASQTRGRQPVYLSSAWPTVSSSEKSRPDSRGTGPRG